MMDKQHLQCVWLPEVKVVWFPLFTPVTENGLEQALGIGKLEWTLGCDRSKSCGWWFAPGMVLPNQVHGGPGRAGGGEELGGLRGMICIQIVLPFREIEDFYRRFWAKRSKQRRIVTFSNHLNRKKYR